MNAVDGFGESKAGDLNAVERFRDYSTGSELNAFEGSREIKEPKGEAVAAFLRIGPKVQADARKSLGAGNEAEVETRHGFVGGEGNVDA